MGHQNLKTVQKMIKFLSILGLVAFVAAKSYEDYESSEEMKEEGDGEGLCFSGLEVALGCTVGTEFGDKLSTALMTCMGDDAEEATRSLNRRRGKGKEGKGKRGKGKGKGKGKGDDCPSVQDIETFIEEEMEGDLCVLYMMGWINDEGEFNEETFGTDVMSLPPSVAETITEESIGTCAAKMMEEWGEDSMMDKCEYKPGEIDEMMELGMEVASYKCFQKIFNKSCKGFVSAHIQGYFEELSAGRR